jgi:hypothetical protein
MAHRHKMHKKLGGRTEYDAKGSHVMKEAHEKNRGGPVTKAVGGPVPGKKSGGRIPKARGGSAGGSDKHPFSSAHHGSKAG